MKARINRSSTGLTLLVATALGVLSLVGPIGQAQAHHNNVGTYAAGVARCDRTQIFVHQPDIFEAWPRAIVGGSQWVKFRTSLAGWFPKEGWRTVAYGTWKKKEAASYSIAAYSWTTLDGRSISPTETFTILSTGTAQNPLYYRVYTEYYWYPDQYRHEGSTWDWNPHQEGRGYYGDQSTYAWCKYPGPN